MLNYLNSLFSKKTYNFGSIATIPSTNLTPEYAYCNNVIVYKCVNMISLTASQVVFESTSKNSLIQKLLVSPNLIEDWSSWVKNVIANRVLYGTAFILFENDELNNIAPHQVKTIVNNHKLQGYEFRDKKYTFLNDYSCAMMRIKNFNPVSPAFGMSPVVAANESIILYNKVLNWNISLVKNGARPSGAFIIDRPLTKAQFDEISQAIERKFSGEYNAGSPMVLNGVDWKEMSINHSDMEFQESKKTAARDIALAFGVPPVLLGIQGDNTYNNLKEARLALWEETIVPILKNLSFTLSKNLSHILNEEIQIVCNFDKIAILKQD